LLLSARRACAGWLGALLIAALAPVSAAADVLRVGTSGDYPPVDPKRSDFEGFDVALARAYAKDRGLDVEFIPFRWPDLNRALLSNRFDLAMSGVTVRPERSAAGRFTVAVAEAGAVIIARPAERFRDVDELNQPPVRIGVNAGGHLEQLASARFPAATLVAIPDNALVLAALLDGVVDAAVSDELEAPRWMRGHEDLALFGPLSVDRKAILLRAGEAQRAMDLNDWLLEREADGTLARLREQFFEIDDSPKVASPLRALLAAIDERLALMPLVAVAKQRDGLSLSVPSREALVIDAAVASVRAAAARRGVAPPPREAVEKLFVAQIEAGKAVQRVALGDPRFRSLETVPNLQTELRPALLRIGERIAQLLVALPGNLDRARVVDAARRELRSTPISENALLAIAGAVSDLSTRSNPED
jgi:cyclohexadienyl dehydratase